MNENQTQQIHLEVDSSSHRRRNAGDSNKTIVLPRLLIAAEVAAAVRKSEKTIYKWAKQGRIPSVINIDGNILFDFEETRQWIDDHRMAA
jgi:predicted DNA-binding transcriptional regulator AlpA